MSLIVRAVVILLIYPFISSTANAKVGPERRASSDTEYRNSACANPIVGFPARYDTLDGNGARHAPGLATLDTGQVARTHTGWAPVWQDGSTLVTIQAEALTPNGDDLAVDDVFLEAEHGDQRRSEAGQALDPRQCLVDKFVAMFHRARRVVPIITDNHPVDRRDDAPWLGEAPQEMKMNAKDTVGERSAPQQYRVAPCVQLTYLIAQEACQSGHFNHLLAGVAGTCIHKLPGPDARGTSSTPGPSRARLSRPTPTQ